MKSQKYQWYIIVKILHSSIRVSDWTGLKSCLIYSNIIVEFWIDKRTQFAFKPLKFNSSDFFASILLIKVDFESTLICSVISIVRCSNIKFSYNSFVTFITKGFFMWFSWILQLATIRRMMSFGHFNEIFLPSFLLQFAVRSHNYWCH